MRLLLLLAWFLVAGCNCGGAVVEPDGGPAGGGSALGGGTVDAGPTSGGAATRRPVALRLQAGGGLFAGSCGNGAVFTVSDAGLAPTDVDVEVRLDGGPAWRFFDSTCAGPSIDRLRIPAGSGSAPFRFRTDTFGAQAVSAEADGLTPDVAMVTTTALVQLDTRRAVVPVQTCALLGHLETVSPGSADPARANRPVRFVLVTANPFGGAATDGGCVNTQFDVTLQPGQSRVPVFASALSASSQPGFLQLSANVPPELTLGAARVELFAGCLPAATTCSAQEPCCAGACDAGVCP